MKDHVALIIKKDKQILFAKRSKFKKNLPNIWAFPTGTVKEGEKIEETAKREAREELGIEVETEKILAIKELPEFGDRLYFLVCIIKSGEPKIQEPKEIDEIQWKTFADFFNAYNDSQIGHGLIYLKNNPLLWNCYN